MIQGSIHYVILLPACSCSTISYVATLASYTHLDFLSENRWECVYWCECQDCPVGRASDNHQSVAEDTGLGLNHCQVHCCARQLQAIAHQSCLLVFMEQISSLMPKGTICPYTLKWMCPVVFWRGTKIPSLPVHSCLCFGWCLNPNPNFTANDWAYSVINGILQIPFKNGCRVSSGLCPSRAQQPWLAVLNLGLCPALW